MKRTFLLLCSILVLSSGCDEKEIAKAIDQVEKKTESQGADDKQNLPIEQIDLANLVHNDEYPRVHLGRGTDDKQFALIIREDGTARVYNGRVYEKTDEYETIAFSFQSELTYVSESQDKNFTFFSEQFANREAATMKIVDDCIVTKGLIESNQINEDQRYVYEYDYEVTFCDVEEIYGWYEYNLDW